MIRFLTSIVLVSFLVCSCTRGRLAPPSPAKLPLKQVILSKPSIHEFVDLLSNHYLWSFKPDGTFTRTYPEHNPSVRTVGTWAELPDGSIDIKGIEDKKTDIQCVIVGYTVVEDSDGLLIVTFETK